MAGEKANKVKFNIKNVHYALLNEGADGEVTWETPKKIPGAVPEKGKNLRVLSKLEDFLFIELSQMIKKWRVV